MYKETALSDVADIREGNMIDIYVDFNNNMIYYFNNEILQVSKSITSLLF